jgi:hypothetical protein
MGFMDDGRKTPDVLLTNGFNGHSCHLSWCLREEDGHFSLEPWQVGWKLNIELLY